MLLRVTRASFPRPRRNTGRKAELPIGSVSGEIKIVIDYQQ